MEYQLICEWCGLPFFSNQPHARFCCDNCASSYSKEKYRQMGIDALEAKICAKVSDNLREGLRSKDVLTTSEAALYLGVCKTTVTRYSAIGLLHVIQLPGKNLFRREELEKLLSSPVKENLTEDSRLTMKNCSSELTTVRSASKAYGISVTALLELLAGSGIQPVRFAGITYFRKSDLREVLGKSPLKDTVKPRCWATHEQIELEYGMTRTAVTVMLRNLDIPSMRKDHTTFFSMDHLRARKKEEDDRFSRLYYSVPQIMEKYHLKDQQIYRILRRYGIRHFKSGTAISVVREEFDRAFGIPEFML